MERINSVIDHITFQNPDNGYVVLKASVKGYRDLQCIVGNFFEVTVGATLVVEGEWRVDKRYGRQFAAQSWTETMPANIIGMEKYLGSGLVKGIGPMYAKRIFREFGTDTLAVIEDRPDDLIRVVS